MIRQNQTLPSQPEKTVIDLMSRSTAIPVSPCAPATRAAALGVLMILMGCSRSTVRIPVSDSTPPLAVLDAIGLDRTLILMVGDEPESVILDPEDSLVLVAIGEDGDGGVKDLILIGNAVVTCAEGAAGAPASRSTGFMRKNVSGSAPRHRAPRRKTHRFVLRAGDFAALCPGRDIAGVVGQANVRTVNFHGGHSTSPRLEFRLARPEPADSALNVNTAAGECPVSADLAGTGAPAADGIAASVIPTAAAVAAAGSGSEACLESALEPPPMDALRPVNPGSKLSPRHRKPKSSAATGKAAPKNPRPSADRRAGI